MKNNYLRYKVLYKISHLNGPPGNVHNCLLSNEISARNIHECLKKAEKRKLIDIPTWYQHPWYQCIPTTIYRVEDNRYYTFVEGFWRESWGIYFPKNWN